MLSRDGIDRLWMRSQDIYEFAALVAAHEREACAKVCDEMFNDEKDNDHASAAFWHAAKAIRARGQG